MIKARQYFIDFCRNIVFDNKIGGWVVQDLRVSDMWLAPKVYVDKVKIHTVVKGIWPLRQIVFSNFPDSSHELLPTMSRLD